jgi:hypothetical protein
MLNPRFLALPAIALAVIVGLAQAHSRPGASQTVTPAVYRAVNCSVAINDSGCAFAGLSGTVR